MKFLRSIVARLGRRSAPATPRRMSLERNVVQSQPNAFEVKNLATARRVLQTETLYHTDSVS